MRAMLGVLAQVGGIVYAAIVLASVVGLTVVIERCWRLLPLSRRFTAVRDRCRAVLHADGAAPAREIVADGEDGMARVLLRGLDTREMDRLPAVQDSVQQEVTALERGLGVLATVGQVAPLLGLLGTVAGLMKAFQAASAAEQVTPALLADGIYQALGTTAAGLCVAIPAWVAYNALAGHVGRLADQLDRAGADLVHHLAAESRA